MKNDIDFLKDISRDLKVHIALALEVSAKTENPLIKDHIAKMQNQLRVLEGEINYLRRVKGA